MVVFVHVGEGLGQRLYLHGDIYSGHNVGVLVHVGEGCGQRSYFDP